MKSMPRLQNARNAASLYNAANCEILLLHHTPASLVPKENIWQHGSLDPVAAKSCCKKHGCSIQVCISHAGVTSIGNCLFIALSILICACGSEKLSLRVTCENCHRVLQ